MGERNEKARKGDFWPKQAAGYGVHSAATELQSGDSAAWR